MSTIIVPATADRRMTALRLLFARFPAGEQEGRLRDALAANERGTLDLRHLLLAETNGCPVGAALVMLQSDGVALVWPPVISGAVADAANVEDLLMRRICDEIDAGSARLGQCLLAPGDDRESEVLRRHGFERATDMFFLARPISGVDLASGSHEADGITVETYGPQTADRFVRLVEESYRGSLDCPFLNDIRTGEDAIASHKLSGQFDPALWALYSCKGSDAGVILVSDHPDQEAVELVYLGVAPGARGQRLGHRMLGEALSSSAQRGRQVMFLAVDCENHFANALYSEYQFSELARRQVMLRRPAGLARQ